MNSAPFWARLAKLNSGESVIKAIRQKQPAYNLISNNCQTYVLELLNAIKVGVDQEIGTTLAVYERLVGPGKVKDLFTTTVEVQDESTGALAPSRPDAPAQTQKQDSVSFAQQVMHDNTTQLNTQDELDRHESEKERKGGSMFSRFTRSLRSS